MCEKRPKEVGEWGVLKVSAVSWDKFNPHENKALPIGLEPRPEHETKAGDFLMSRANTSNLVGKSVIVENTPERLLLSDKLLRVSFSALTDKIFFNLYNNSLAARDYYSKKASGTSTSMRNISRGQILDMPIPIPPLTEQKHIVAKVDQLMALCDELEARQQKRREGCVRLNNAAIEQFLTTREPHDFSKHWQCICDNFDLLYSAPENIGKLRQAILQLAVQGKLVPQDSNDEPASVLLEKIKAEKERLIKEGKMKREKPLSPIEVDELPFELSESWKWVRMQEIFSVITDGDHQPPPKTESGIPFLVIGNVREGVLNFTNTRFVSEEYFLSIDESRTPRRGDILYTVVGSYGIPIIVDTAQLFCVQRHIAILKPSKLLEVGYLNYLLKSDIVFAQATKYATGIAQKTVPLNGLRKIIVPLPPAEEQKRIASKVNQLLVLCDELEAKLIQSQTDSEKLMDAAVRQFLMV